MQKRLPILLLALVLVGGTGYAVAQLLIQRNLSGSVTIVADPGLTIYDLDGVEISSLDYGEISLGVWEGIPVIVRNTGDIALSLTCARIDDNTMQVSTNFAHLNGDWFAPNTPKLLQPDDEITVVIEVIGTEHGAWSLEFAFYGEG